MVALDVPTSKDRSRIGRRGPGVHPRAHVDAPRPNVPTGSPAHRLLPLHGVGAELAVRPVARGRVRRRAHRGRRRPSPTRPSPPSRLAQPEEKDALQPRHAPYADKSGPTSSWSRPRRRSTGCRRTEDAGTWRALTGNEIGGCWPITCWRAQGEDPVRSIDTAVVVVGLVPPSPRPAAVRRGGTLTGFKWIVRPAIDRPDCASSSATKRRSAISVDTPYGTRTALPPRSPSQLWSLTSTDRVTPPSRTDSAELSGSRTACSAPTRGYWRAAPANRSRPP